MVQDEGEFRQLPDGGDGRGQLPRKDEQVVGEAGLRDRAQPPVHVGPGQPARVPFGLHQVPDAHQEVAAGRRPQGVQRAGETVRGEVGPAYDAG